MHYAIISSVINRPPPHPQDDLQRWQIEKRPQEISQFFLAAIVTAVVRLQGDCVARGHLDHDAIEAIAVRILMDINGNVPNFAQEQFLVSSAEKFAWRIVKVPLPRSQSSVKTPVQEIRLIPTNPTKKNTPAMIPTI
jgi:hypothetical protein